MAVVFVMMIIIWAIDYRVFDIAGYVLYSINLILLIVVLFMPKLMGASSWFNLGGILYQPSELMKIAFIICFAKFATMYKENASNCNIKRKFFLITLMILTFSISVVLILLQPDFGTAVAFV